VALGFQTRVETIPARGFEIAIVMTARLTLFRSQVTEMKPGEIALEHLAKENYRFSFSQRIRLRDKLPSVDP
jgi:hypothetical protein